jgi:hypothetical protein
MSTQSLLAVRPLDAGKLSASARSEDPWAGHYQNKAVVYEMLFHASAETLRTIAADPKHLGAEIGFIGILHTWGQNLQHHPHLHCVVPGGGLSVDGARWISCRASFFVPV